MKLCGFDVGLDQPIFLMAGPCVIESEQMILDIAKEMKAVCDDLGIHYIFKASYDKANRTSGNSFRGPGIEDGLKMLANVRERVGVPVVTDVHTAQDVPLVAQYVDVLQTPAFLCRQTDFIRACAQSGKPVNIKKGQFLSPHDMKNVIEKARAAAREVGLDDDMFMACERGASFGYGNLVSDMRSLAIMRETGAPVVFDATHLCNCLAAMEQALAVVEPMFLFYPVLQLEWGLQDYLWKHIPILNAPRATVPTWFH